LGRVRERTSTSWPTANESGKGRSTSPTEKTNGPKEGEPIAVEVLLNGFFIIPTYKAKCCKAKEKKSFETKMSSVGKKFLCFTKRVRELNVGR